MKSNYKVTTPMPLIPDIDQEDSELSLFDPTNPDINLFNLVDDEIIRLGGSKLYFYKFFRSEDEYDDVYLEIKNKAIHSEPMLVHGHYDPKVLEENLTEFGIELTNDQIFIFNKSYIKQKLGREVIPGDIIKPAFQNQKYEIFEVQEDAFEAYGVYHLNCSAKLLRDSAEIQETPLVNTSDFGGGYSGQDGEI